MVNQLTLYDVRTTLARTNPATCPPARVTAALKCEGAISVEADLIRVPATANVDGEVASSTQSHTHIGTGHDDIGSTTGDGMNKEMRRDPRQSESAPSASVPVAGLACETPVDRRRFLIGMRTIAAIGAGALALTSGWRSARAQSYPTAPVKLIVTTGAGGAPDVIARIVAEGL